MTAATEFWRELFGDDAPVEVEIGAGDGRFLLAAVARDPATNFFGIERSRSKARRLAARLERLGTARVRSLHADASCVVQTLIPDRSVAAYHLYFPDPWPKRRHAKRRIMTPAFTAALARTLVGGGRLYIATDVYGYLRLMRITVDAEPDFVETPSRPEHPGLETAFARKYRAAGRPLYTATFVRRA